MPGYKDLSELTLMDDYMFGVVMRDPRLIRPLIEEILGFRIHSLSFAEAQRTVKEGYESRGVKLDLFVTDEAGTVYNVEVQTSDRKNLPRRMRYYQSVIDRSVLSPGVDYRELARSYIIFICSYDPYETGRALYTFEYRCLEDLFLPFGDDTRKNILNTKGSLTDISPELRQIIRYLDKGIAESEYTRQLKEAVRGVKTSEERRVEYMVMMIREMEIREDSKEKGRQESTERSLHSLMKNLGFSLRQAMDALDIPGEERETYVRRLEQTGSV